MTNVENIDHFNSYAATIFAKLYTSFPEPIMLDHGTLAEEHLQQLGHAAWEPDVIAAAVQGDKRLEREPQQRTTEFRSQESLAWHTIRWLAKCSYIQANEQVNDESRNACRYVLSPKGFEALSAAPESLKSKKSIGATLADAGKNVASQAGRKALSELVGAAIGAALRGTFLGNTGP
ncbi:MAG: hypothetical protein RIC55_26565 [Pirellulaceae bacterium]